MKRTWFAAAGFIICVVVGFLALYSSITTLKQQGTEVTSEPYRRTLRGEFLCLPHIDQSGPQTEECAFGVQTDTGEYYALDFSLMSAEHPQVNTGQHFTATGMITSVERVSSDHWRQYPIKGIFSVTDSMTLEGGPSTDATPARVTTHLDGTVTGLSVSVSPIAIVSDSRCPEKVACIWAGTVEVRTVLSTPVGHGEHVLTLGKPQVFGDSTVTLVEVAPIKTEAAISDSSYRFTFEIKKVE